MATARLRRHSSGGGARRPTRVLAFVVALAGLALLAMLGSRSTMPGLLGHSLIDDKRTAEQLYELAKAAKSEADFEARLQSAGLMSGGSISSSSSSGKGGGGKGGGGKKGGGGGGGGKLDVPLLSRELAHQHARDGIIIVTWANFHFFDFVLNWVHHMGMHGIENYLVGAMDEQTGQALAAEGLNVFAMYDVNAGQNDTGLGTADFGWGSPTFHKMGRQKVDLARTFTGYGLDLCLCDVDTVWINDPTEYFERYPQASILASSDDLSPSNPPGDDGLEQLDSIHSAMNIGLLFFRHGPNLTRFIDAWQQQLDADDKAWDQNVFNWVARSGLFPFESPPDSPRLVWAANHSLLVGVLPVASFASGHTFFVQRLFEFQKIKPYVVHTTFQYGGSSGKKHRLREAMLWIDSPEYYGADGAGRFLAVDLEYPATPKGYQEQDQMMMDSRFKTDWKNDDMIDLHLKNMAAQLGQLRYALQLAVVLNRTIIMPKLISWCDRYWGPVEFCQVPGAFKTRLPFVAPMDHILEPHNLADASGDQPRIPYREYSFLLNERTPKALLETQLVVTPEAGLKAAEMRGGAQGGKALHIPTQLPPQQLREMLAPYDDVQLIHFTAATGAVGPFEEPRDGQRFNDRLMHMSGFFCCRKVAEGEDGGVSYTKFLGPPLTTAAAA